MSKKTDYVAWGLDEATPTIIDESLEKRERIVRKITGRLDYIGLLMLLSLVVNFTLALIVITKI